MVTAAALALSTAAVAHTLGLQCKKIVADNIVCRTIASDGEVARDVESSLTEDEHDAVLATTKTDAQAQILPGTSVDIR